MEPDSLRGRCGSCARFARAHDVVDERSGATIRVGECMLGVWPSPLKATGTCSQWVESGRLGELSAKKSKRAAGVSGRSRSSPERPERLSLLDSLGLPEDLLTMDKNEFREILREVIREELAPTAVELGSRWQGGEMVLQPGKSDTQEKRVPLEAFFHKIVMVRDKLRVLEQKVNSASGLTADEKVQLQQYITGCYGTLTTFNVLFRDREDWFVGQSGKE